MLLHNSNINNNNINNNNNNNNDINDNCKLHSRSIVQVSEAGAVQRLQMDEKRFETNPR